MCCLNSRHNNNCCTGLSPWVFLYTLWNAEHPVKKFVVKAACFVLAVVRFHWRLVVSHVSFRYAAARFLKWLFVNRHICCTTITVPNIKRRVSFVVQPRLSVLLRIFVSTLDSCDVADIYQNCSNSWCFVHVLCLG